MCPAPLAFERHALVEAVVRQLLVAVVGVFGQKAVDVVALGLVAAPGEVAQVVGVVDVVLERAVRLEGEEPDVHAADHLAPLVRQADDAQALPVGVGVRAQRRDERGEVPLADGLHVADLLAAVDPEADHQESVDLGPGAVVDLLPAVHVGEGEVAVADSRGHRIAFDRRSILKAYGVEFNHEPYSFLPRCAYSIAGQAPRNGA